jgi:hypothetical protein
VSFLFPSVTAAARNQSTMVLLLGSLLLANQAAVALCATESQGMTSIGPILLALLGSVLLVVRRPHR